MKRNKFLLLTILFFGLLSSSQAGNTLNKNNAEISITNQSMQNVMLVGIRMLNERHDKWFSVYRSNQELSSFFKVKVEIFFDQGESTERIFQLEFKRALKDGTGGWGEIEYTSDFKLNTDTQKPLVNTVIVEKRS